MSKKLLYKVLSVVLSVTMLFSNSNVIPIITSNIAYAAPPSQGSETTPPSSPKPAQSDKEKQISQKEAADNESYVELVDKRQPSTKYYQLSSGKYEAVKFGYPVHYKENGKYVDIDNTLVESKDKDGKKVYSNKANDFKVSLYNIAEKYLATITKGDYSISWNIDGISPNNSAKSDTFITKEKWNGLSKGDQRRNLPGISSKAEYKGAVNGADVQMILLSNILKQNIVLSEYNDNSEYSEHLYVEGLMLVANKDGTIVAVDEKDQKTVVFKFKAPFAMDTEGNTSDIKTSLEKVGDYEYTLTYSLDGAWLKKASYPVTVDPSITTSMADADIDDTRLEEGQPTYNGCDSYIMCTGYGSTSHTNYSLVKFRNMPVLGQADMVVYAGYRVKLAGTYGSSNISVHNVTSAWTNSTVTWNSRPTFDSNVEDYCVVGGAAGSTSEWDITHIAKKWYSGGANYGLLLKDTSNQTSTSNYKSWYTCDATYGDVPYAYFVYVNYSGLESYWDYATSGIGRGGEANVNLYNGNLIYTHTDLSMTGERMPVTVTHTFNSTTRNDDQWIILCGSGWMTNFDQYLSYKVINNVTYYVYTDADGTKHYYRDADGNGTFNDDSGIDTTLSWAGTRWELKDKQDNRICFDSLGFLSCIIDKDGNQQTITRNSSYQVTSITDGAGRVIVFERNADGTLNRIKDPSNRYAATYTYTGGRLTRITYADNNYISFTYDGNGNLTTATNFDGNKVTITYNASSPYRISRIEESNGTTLGGRMDFSYGLNQTSVTDVQGRTAQYQFNDNGNTVCVIAPDGSAQYTAFGTNINGTSSNDINKITSVSKVQKFGKNYLVNGGMEVSSNWSIFGDSSITFASDQKYLGTQSVKSVKTQSSSNSGISQALTLEKGKTYTFSGYLKTSNIVSTTSGGASFVLMYYDASGTAVWLGTPRVAGTTDWQRYSITFTVPSNATSASVVVDALTDANTSGTAWFDCLQLEDGTIANRFNLVENADFDSYSGNTPTFWSRGNLAATDTMETSSDSTNLSIMSDNRFKIVGECIDPSWKNLYQLISISGDTGDTYVFGGWGKGNSIPVKKDYNRGFYVELTFHYTDGTVGFNVAKLNEDSSAWQYTCNAAVASKPYSNISVELAYTGNANAAYFDGVNVFKEQFGNTFSYDANGNLVAATDAEKKSESFQYTNNNLTKYIKPNNSEYNYAYDTHHNLTSATSSQGLVYSYGYDAYGNNTESKVGNTSVYIRSTVSYDSNGNYVDVVRDPFNKTLNYDYDTSKGTLSQVTDQLGTATTYSYDPNLDRLTGASETYGSETLSNSYTYSGDKLSTVSHNAPSGNVSYSFDYDALGRNIGTNVGSVDLVSYTLQPRTGRLESVTYGNGQTVNYSYDAYDRLTGITQGSTTLYSYSYDNQGRVGLLVDNVQGVEYRYEYDSLERIGKVSMNDGSNPTSITYGFSNANNLISVAANMGSLGSFTSSYAYDNDDRPTTSTVGSLSTQYNYDSILGRTSSYELKNNGSTVYTTSYWYDTPEDQSVSTRSGRVGTITNQKTNGTQENQMMAYDDRGFITQIFQDANNYSQYAYNAFGELIRENYKWGGTSYTVIYAYDIGGNMTSKTTYAFAEADTTPATQMGLVNYTYDATWKDKLSSYNGNSITYDAIGNPTGYNGWTYSWTQGRKLQQASNASTTATYKYNDSGIRTEKTVNGVTTKYTLEGDKVLWEKSSNSGTPIIYYYDSTGKLFGLKYNGTDYFYIRNLQGDIVKIVDVNGDTQVQYAYDAWGNIQSVTGNLASTLGQANPYRYRGYRYDNETGLYYLQDRYYNPEWGRFINADDTSTIGVSPMSLTNRNLFAYCDNNPVTREDDGGQFWHIIAGGILGGLIGGITKVVSNFIEGKSLTNGLFAAVVSGVASGALAATGVGIVGQAIGNAAISAGESIIRNNGIKDVGEFLTDTAVGGLSGAIGGKGFGSNYLNSLGKQSVSRTLNTLEHSGISAAVSEGKKAATYYVKNASKLVINGLRGISKSGGLSLVMNIASTCYRQFATCSYGGGGR